MTGFVILLGGGLISWSVCQQGSVSILLTEAEVMAINDMVRQLRYIRKLFELLGIDLTRVITLYNDNQSAIKIVTDLMGKTYCRALKHTASRSSICVSRWRGRLSPSSTA
jgi:hypothetical protein